MKKYIIMAMAMYCTAIYGQQQNETIKISDDTVKNTVSVEQKLKNLESDFELLKLSYDLYKLNTNITLFTNELRITENELKIHINNRNYDYKLYKAYKQNYETLAEKAMTYQILIVVSKENFDYRLQLMQNKSYPEKELRLLRLDYEQIDSGYASIEFGLNMYKRLLETYRDL